VAAGKSSFAETETFMRARTILPFLALFLLAAGQGLAQAAEDDGGTVVHLTERAERQMPRDRLSATLRADAEGLDPAKVQDEINRRMQDALAQAKAVAAVKVESGSYSVYRQPPPVQNSTAPEKWVASQTMIITSKNFAPALTLIGTLQAAGLTMEALNFDVAPETLRAVQDEMTTEALAAMRTRADHVASGMSMSILRYKTLDVGNVTTQEARPPMPMRMMAAKATPAETPPVADAGESTAFLMVDAQVVLGMKKAP
jgi:predicted secreted protein